MAFQRIRIKNTNVSGKIPGADKLDTAELCINLKDQKLFSKDADGNVFELGGGKVESGPTPPSNGNETGDLFWDGDFLLVWNGSEWVPVGQSDLDYVADPAKGTITNTNGDDVDLPLVDQTNAGLMSPEDFKKLGEMPAVISGDTQPGNPSLGDIWIDTGDCPPTINIWDDCDDPGNPTWKPIGGGGLGGCQQGPVQIIGESELGSTLTATGGNGTDEGTGLTATYEWTGAKTGTGSTIVADVEGDYTVTATITCTDGSTLSTSATKTVSDSYVDMVNNTPPVIGVLGEGIDGAYEGNSIYVVTNATVVNGDTPTIVENQWFKDDAADGTGTLYAIGAGDEGKVITCKQLFRDARTNELLSEASNGITIVARPADAITFTAVITDDGTPQANTPGHVLTASAENIVGGTAPIEYEYKWVVDGLTMGQNKTLNIISTFVGKIVTCDVTVAEPDGTNPETRTATYSKVIEIGGTINTPTVLGPADGAGSGAQRYLISDTIIEVEDGGISTCETSLIERVDDTTAAPNIILTFPSAQGFDCFEPGEEIQAVYSGTPDWQPATSGNIVCRAEDGSRWFDGNPKTSAAVLSGEGVFVGEIPFTTSFGIANDNDKSTNPSSLNKVIIVHGANKIRTDVTLQLPPTSNTQICKGGIPVTTLPDIQSPVHAIEVYSSGIGANGITQVVVDGAPLTSVPAGGVFYGSVGIVKIVSIDDSDPYTITVDGGEWFDGTSDPGTDRSYIWSSLWTGFGSLLGSIPSERPLPAFNGDTTLSNEQRVEVTEVYGDDVVEFKFNCDGVYPFEVLIGRRVNGASPVFNGVEVTISDTLAVTDAQWVSLGSTMQGQNVFSVTSTKGFSTKNNTDIFGFKIAGNLLVDADGQTKLTKETAYDTKLTVDSDKDLADMTGATFMSDGTLGATGYTQTPYKLVTSEIENVALVNQPISVTGDYYYPPANAFNGKGSAGSVRKIDGDAAVSNSLLTLTVNLPYTSKVEFVGATTYTAAGGTSGVRGYGINGGGETFSTFTAQLDENFEGGTMATLERITVLSGAGTLDTIELFGTTHDGAFYLSQVWIDDELIINGTTLTFTDPNPDLEYFRKGDVIQDSPLYSDGVFNTNNPTGMFDGSTPDGTITPGGSVSANGSLPIGCEFNPPLTGVTDIQFAMNNNAGSMVYTDADDVDYTYSWTSNNNYN